MSKSETKYFRLTSVASAIESALGRGLPLAEARALLAQGLHKERLWLVAHPDELVDDTAMQRFETLTSARLRGEPMAYLVGEREFFGRAFTVSAEVLIPRPETELLVEFALQHAPHGAAALDLGSGSGAIAVTLAAERPDLKVCATDLSAQALVVSRTNGQTHAPGRVDWRCGDWYEPLDPDARFDLIVSNPPYIGAGDPHLSQGDLRFEPRQALTDERDGMTALRAIIEAGFARLKPGGWLAVEHGYDQAARVSAIFSAARFINVGSQRDLANIERITFGQRRN